VKFSLQTKLTVLITAKHKNIPMDINSCDMAMPAGNAGDVLRRLKIRLRLFIKVRSLEKDVSPSKNYMRS
jgi:hypothetical protein